MPGCLTRINSLVSQGWRVKIAENNPNTGNLNCKYASFLSTSKTLLRLQLKESLARFMDKLSETILDGI